MSYFKYDSIEESIKTELDSSDLSLSQKIQALLKVLEYLSYNITETKP